MSWRAERRLKICITLGIVAVILVGVGFFVYQKFFKGPDLKNIIVEQTELLPDIEESEDKEEKLLQFYSDLLDGKYTYSYQIDNEYSKQQGSLISNVGTIEYETGVISHNNDYFGNEYIFGTSIVLEANFDTVYYRGARFIDERYEGIAANTENFQANFDTKNHGGKTNYSDEEIDYYCFNVYFIVSELIDYVDDKSYLSFEFKENEYKVATLYRGEEDLSCITDGKTYINCFDKGNPCLTIKLNSQEDIEKDVKMFESFHYSISSDVDNDFKGDIITRIMSEEIVLFNRFIRLKTPRNETIIIEEENIKPDARFVLFNYPSDAFTFVFSMTYLYNSKEILMEFDSKFEYKHDDIECNYTDETNFSYLIQLNNEYSDMEYEVLVVDGNVQINAKLNYNDSKNEINYVYNETGSFNGNEFISTTLNTSITINQLELIIDSNTFKTDLNSTVNFEKNDIKDSSGGWFFDYTHEDYVASLFQTA